VIFRTGLRRHGKTVCYRTAQPPAGTVDNTAAGQCAGYLSTVYG
jgi:hypothetical protein